MFVCGKFTFVDKNYNKGTVLFLYLPVIIYSNQGFGSAFFFADPDPGKNLHADPDPVPDPDPDPGGIRGRGLGVKGKNDFFLSFFHVSDDS